MADQLTFDELFRTVPLGTVICFTDGTPQPPARFTKKLADWKNRNGLGVLTAKRVPPTRAHCETSYDTRDITLRLYEVGTPSTIVMTVSTTINEKTALTFSVDTEAPDQITVNSLGQAIPAADLLTRARRGDALLQHGEANVLARDTITPLGFPRGATLVQASAALDMYRFSDTVYAVRHSDSAVVEFPNSLGTGLIEHLAEQADPMAELARIVNARLDQGIFFDTRK